LNFLPFSGKIKNHKKRTFQDEPMNYVSEKPEKFFGKRKWIWATT
jgi:hypothetical protein